MLDDMMLSDKVKVAREWFRKAGTGELKFTRASQETFLELLRTIEMEVALQSAALNIAQARLTLLDFEAARTLPALAAAAEVPITAANVVRLQLRPHQGGGR